MSLRSSWVKARFPGARSRRNARFAGDLSVVHGIMSHVLEVERELDQLAVYFNRIFPNGKGEGLLFTGVGRASRIESSKRNPARCRVLQFECTFWHRFKILNVLWSESISCPKDPIRHILQFWYYDIFISLILIGSYWIFLINHFQFWSYWHVGGLEHVWFFHSVGNSQPNWLIFFRGVGSITNQWLSWAISWAYIDTWNQLEFKADYQLYE